MSNEELLETLLDGQTHIVGDVEFKPLTKDILSEVIKWNCLYGVPGCK